VSVILSLKELLNVSSDWLDVKSTHKGSIPGGSNSNAGSNSTNTNTVGGSSVPADFQSIQIEKIIDALSLALPSRPGVG
jgi:hypothetical protein